MSRLEVATARIKKILTRTSGFLKTVCSHSLQPYRGCSFGNALCGVGCYVQHNAYLTRGQPWGSFLEVRENAAEAYRAECEGERRWARSHRGAFKIFMSSSTDPFLPQERRFRITRSVLKAMLDYPPDLLIVQTHSHLVTDALDLYPALASRFEVRFHISIETDRESIPALPPHATPLSKRFEAAAALKQAGLHVVITVSPLLPIADPDTFFARIAEVADAVVIDHFIEGDGTADGRRTWRTPVPAACQKLEPRSIGLAYRDEMAAVASRYLPGRVGINIDGFAGRFGSRLCQNPREREP